MKKEALRFIAGENRQDAVARIKRLNGQRIRALIDFLGEEVKDKNKVKTVVEEYKRLIYDIKKKKLNAAIDLKLTNIGLAIDTKTCLRNLKDILFAAKKAKLQVWIDAEQQKYRDAATQIYINIRDEFPDVYLTVQAYFKDSFAYLERIIHSGGTVRLVKGAYPDKNAIRSGISGNFTKMMKHLFLSSDHFAIATHDDKILSEALRLQKIYHKDVEFQFLLGLSEKFVSQLKRFENVAEYVPYGKDWQGYYKRRLLYLKHHKTTTQ